VSFRDEVPAQYWELVNEYRDELVAQAISVGCVAADAEDVVQETFCEAFRDAQKIMTAQSIGTTLRLINRRNALNRIRSKKRADKKARLKHELAPDRSVTTGGFSQIDVNDTLAKAVESLPEHLRQIVILRFWQHLSYKEIADRLNIPIGNIGRLLSGATLLLSEAIDFPQRTGPEHEG
jgi:RNA polymerase sigma-70 factor (ECF subfamily)